MARIKFVLWERYRAWWGAHELNEQDPLLIDRLKEEEKNKRVEKILEERAKMSKTQLERLKRKRELEVQKWEARKEMARVAAEEAKRLAQQEAKELAELQKLAAGRGPEANQSS
jgi:beta-glucosidase-like glycosyl hydrolase